ncbi:hypothetical protein PoMZ_03079 [Pyricularia oryzae]|uniref:Uncharacterized protein n=1 Tax=Pyricularia oryzae TaxID=318829 RepID=A0A4P7N6C0_PYROR|nr:hypothetical protein PoMZ_03079 [Pyricularia oryzae]
MTCQQSCLRSYWLDSCEGLLECGGIPGGRKLIYIYKLPYKTLKLQPHCTAATALLQTVYAAPPPAPTVNTAVPLDLTGNAATTKFRTIRIRVLMRHYKAHALSHAHQSTTVSRIRTPGSRLARILV